MRMLGIGDWCDLSSLYRRLQAEGHEVRVVVTEMRAQRTLEGYIPVFHQLAAGLSWIGDDHQESLIIFEDAKQGELQDRLRQAGYRVVGGSAYGSRLEGDRSFAQAELRELQLPVARTECFDDYAAAIRFLRSQGGRWVYKYNGDRFPSTHTYIGELPDASDLIAVLTGYQRRWKFLDRPSFVLMERKSGVEIGVGAWFNGTEFLDGAHCIDFEHKRFCNGDLGELTGEMGTLVRYRGGERLFAHLLLPLTSRLRASGYHGWINLNTIIDAQGVWPLEFTCRFGYPGFAILEALQHDAWGDLLTRVACGDGRPLRTRDDWSLGIVLTIPPFPNLRSEDQAQEPERVPVFFRRSLTVDEAAHMHFNEIALEDGTLVNQGVMGNLMVVTGIGETVRSAQTRTLELARQVVAAQLRYRTDIGERFITRDFQQLVDWGWLDPGCLP
jgi:phosphoribosylamine--glycine ligase